MKRREFATLLAGALASPLLAHAEGTRVPRVGFLGPTAADIWRPWTQAFTGRFAELGWVDGQTVNIIYRWADGQSERASEFAAELAALKVDLIITSGSGTGPAMRATSHIPIVFALASEPVATGYVSSLARPGGNATGLSVEAPNLGGKRLEYLRQVVPGAHRLAVLTNMDYLASRLDLERIKAVAPALGFEPVPVEVRRPEDIEPAFAKVGRSTEAMYVCSADPLMNNNRVRINVLALGARLPTIYAEKAYAEAGGLLSYGPNIPDLFRRAAGYADKILRGAKPADLPVEAPNSFELIINQKTARALGLTIPLPLIAGADEVID